MAARKTNFKLHLTFLCSLLIIGVAGCADSATGFYPLNAGRWWYYRTETTILDDKREQRFLVANLGRGEHAGEKVYLQRQSAGRELYFQRTSRGVERVGTRVGVGESPTLESPTLVLPADLELASSWTTTSRLALIESRTFARQDKLRNINLPVDLTISMASIDETISVPAGTFESCIRLDGTGTRTVRTDRGNANATVTVILQEWYAPGIGLVKMTRSENSESPFLKTGYFTQELLQFEH